MFTDLRYAFRLLAKSRGSALIAVFTLAVGIGSSTAMFSTLRALVVEPFDYPDSDELVQIWSGNNSGWPLSPADFHDLHEQMTSFEYFGVYAPTSVNVGLENAQAVRGARATRDVLRVFGIAPLRGRLFTADDEIEQAPPVAVISYTLWQKLGGDPGVVGREVRVNGTNATVVGIMPRGFEFAAPWMRTEDCQIWLPYRFTEKERTQRDSHWLCGVARLRDGVTFGAAQAESRAIGKKLAALYPDSNLRKEFGLKTLKFEMTKDIGEKIWMLFGAVTLVLLVACANVASMLLARSAQRQGEFGVRVALGATRGRLVRLALAESAVLATLGAAFGCLVALGGIKALQAISPVGEARKAAMTLDGTALLFALGACFVTALLAILPAFAAARTSLAGIIRSDARGAVGSRSRQIMLRTLVIGQIALAFVLANGAALFSTSYFKILEQNKALDSEYVLSAKLNLRGDTYKENEDRVRFWRKLEETLAALPGVTSIGLTSKLPLEGGSNTNALVNDEVYDPAIQRTSVERSSVTANYFQTMDIALVRGRNLTDADDVQKGGHQGVIVNRAFVEKCWPDKDPIGQVFRANQAKDPWYTATVVGVVENVRQWSATAKVQPEMYTTPPGHWGNTIHITLRSSRPAAFLAPQLREAVARLDREMPLESVRTMNQVVRDSSAGERAVANLVNFFMATALGLVAVGLYGTLSYYIVQRTREIGVRLAIGAVGGNILGLVFGQGMRWVAIGLALGLGGTLALTKVLKGLVYGMEGLTAAPLLMAAGVVAVAATVAILIPAWRASKMDPLVALRLD